MRNFSLKLLFVCLMALVMVAIVSCNQDNPMVDVAENNQNISYGDNLQDEGDDEDEGDDDDDN